jgi:4-amino-4-deoxy-L-arabinose transferase-like glycosyltransferase
VRPVVTRWLPLALVATVVLGVFLLFVPIDRDLVLRIYLLVVAALALLTGTAATTFAARRRRSSFEAAMRPRSQPSARPEELVRLERQVLLATENAADFHFRLRPSLVAAAEGAVWRRHGVPLEQAEPHLPPALWEVVRPDRPPPEDRRAPGPALDELEALLDEIARIRA